MSIYTTKEVPLKEEEKLVSFINQHWKKDHALVKSRSLLYYQHFNNEKQTFNFIVGENNNTKEYDALIGYIPTSQYDSSLNNHGDYWGAIWKIRDDVNNEEIHNIAFFIWKKLFKLPNFHSYAAIGISEIAKRIYQASRIPLGILNQFYIANEKINQYKIAKNPQIYSGIKSENNWKITLIPSLSFIDLPKYNYMPFKSGEYFINRYERHPIYRYIFWGIYDESDNLVNVWVLRRHIVGNSSIYRIVDVLGDLNELPCLYSQIQNKLQEEKCEYVDFMNFGIDSRIFEKVGFNILNPESKDVIIPNYFEPFLQENIKVEIAYKSIYENYVAFKADSDQDRPNIL